MNGPRLFALLVLAFARGAFGDVSIAFKGFEPEPACIAAFVDIVKGSITYPAEGGVPQIVGARDLSQVRLRLGNDRFPDPVSLFTALMEKNPWGRDPILVDAIENMKAPIDPTRFSVLCVPSECKLTHQKGEALGIHFGYGDLKRFKNTHPGTETKAWNRFREQAMELPLIELRHQTVALHVPLAEKIKNDSQSTLSLWYATVAHEAVHVSFERTLVDWMNGNIRRLKVGQKPDRYFLRYARFEDGKWGVDQAFSDLLHEGLAYSITGSTYDLVAVAVKGAKVDSSYEVENWNNKPFEAYTAVRPDIKTELQMNSHTWYRRSREIRGELLRSIETAP